VLKVFALLWLFLFSLFGLCPKNLKDFFSYKAQNFFYMKKKASKKEKELLN